MLAYVFWHARAPSAETGEYERALLAFHRSLAHTPPIGFHGSTAFRVGTWPWEAPPLAGGAYEDWYLVEDFASLGVLNEAAVGRGHRTSHDRAARGVASGTAGAYRLIEGEIADASALARCTHATWVAPARGARHAELGAMLADGADRRAASLWQRQLVLGPAPEFCVLAAGTPAGAAAGRLPAGWSAATHPRESVHGVSG